MGGGRTWLTLDSSTLWRYSFKISLKFCLSISFLSFHISANAPSDPAVLLFFRSFRAFSISMSDRCAKFILCLLFSCLELFYTHMSLSTFCLESVASFLFVVCMFLCRILKISLCGFRQLRFWFFSITFWILFSFRLQIKLCVSLNFLWVYLSFFFILNSSFELSRKVTISILILVLI